MKQPFLKFLAAFVFMLVGMSMTLHAGTYATSLRVSNPDSTKPFDGSFSDTTGARLWFTLNGHADTVKVWVRKGNERIRKFDPLLNLAVGPHSVAWDGKDDSGKVVMNGRFNFEVFTSDTGNSSALWVQGWQNSVYLAAGTGLSSRDIEVVNDPMSPAFGNLILTEATTFYGFARMLSARADGSFQGEYGRALFPQGTSNIDPWFISIAKNGLQYVTSGSLNSIFVFRDSVMVNTIKDIAAPRGIVAVGNGDPTLLVATGKAVVRRMPNGAIDTVFAAAEALGYTEDVAVDDSGYVYVAFGASATAYTKVVRLSKTYQVIDTLTLPDYVTHLTIAYGADRASNADDIIYARARGANGGVFKLDYATTTFAKLFTPATSTSAYHSIATDLLGNIYYANPSNEWVRMYIAPTTAPRKWNTVGGEMNVMAPSNVIDNFNTTVGRFTGHPTFSGSTTGIDGGSTAVWNNANSASGAGGSIAITLLDNPSLTTAWGVRFLSGGGSPGNNFNLSPNGWVGFWMKTSQSPPGATVAIGLDDSGDPVTKRSVQLPVIGDGKWRLYQWNIADSNHWTPWVVTSGNKKIVGPTVSIDAVWFMADDNAGPWSLYLDDVSHNLNGPLGHDAGRGDVTNDGTISVLDASWILQHTVKLRQFNPQQIQTGDVNLSHNGVAVNAMDAAIVLANVVGKIPSLPWTQPPPPLNNINGNDPAPLSVMIASAKGTVGQKVTIPIYIPAELAGLRSAEMEVNFDPSLLKIINVAGTSLTQDFAVVSNVENNSIRIAMASAEAIQLGGQILNIEAEIIQTSQDIGFIVKNIYLNEKFVESATSVGAGLTEIPQTYELLQNYPNPFNPTTTIAYRLAERGFVELKVYDISGREVITLMSSVQDAGEHRITWNAEDSRGIKVSSGVYLYRVTSGSFTQIKKMVLLK